MRTGVARFGRKELDLLADGAAEQLAALLQADDTLVMVSARAPCKTPAMMLENIRMMASVCDALVKRPIAHLVYVSSDAVYADGPLPLTETSPAAPMSLHGAMHLAREQMLLSVSGTTPLAILRPTLVYGAGDPHSGYGPNKFRRRPIAAKQLSSSVKARNAAIMSMSTTSRKLPASFSSTARAAC